MFPKKKKIILSIIELNCFIFHFRMPSRSLIAPGVLPQGTLGRPALRMTAFRWVTDLFFFFYFPSANKYIFCCIAPAASNTLPHIVPLFSKTSCFARPPCFRPPCELEGRGFLCAFQSSCVCVLTVVHAKVKKAACVSRLDGASRTRSHLRPLAQKKHMPGLRHSGECTHTSRPTRTWHFGRAKKSLSRLTGGGVAAGWRQGELRGKGVGCFFYFYFFFLAKRIRFFSFSILTRAPRHFQE